MAWFSDLSPCDYFGPQVAASLIAVGWLERGRQYATGIVAIEVYEALVNLVRDPWQPVASAGSHGCDLCHFVSEARCSSTVFIPANGHLFVSPTLITHYVNAHGYAPPKDFCNAVLACPPMRSMEYLQSVLASGGRHLVQLATA
jgi:hypothetical protein